MFSHLSPDKMSFKKLDKKSKKAAGFVFGRERDGEKKLMGGGSGEGHKNKLQELLSLIQQEFDQLQAENAECE